MYYADFLSQPPMNLISHKRSQKTNIGGFLSIIYIFIMIYISLAYIIDYFCNDKYLVEYYSFFNTTNNDNTKLNNDPELDPEINFSFELLDGRGKELSEDYKLYKDDVVELKRNEYYKFKVSEFKITLRYDDYEREKDYGNWEYLQLKIKYSGFELNHQSDEAPLIKTDKKYFEFIHYFYPKERKWVFLNWEVIKYKEEKGVAKLFNLFQIQDDEYTSGFISSFKEVLMNELLVDDEEIILNIKMFNYHNTYAEYKRKKIGILDLLSKLGALYSTFYTCFIVSLRYYSNNFNNYKIIENIVKTNFINMKEIELSNNLNMNIKNNNNLNISNNEEKEKEEKVKLKDNSNDNNSNRSIPLLNTNLLDVNDLEFDLNSNKENEEKNPLKDLPKFSFFHFLFNNIYYNSCDKVKEQEIINVYNQIIGKYFSVETIILNQIKLEHLFKDYKWNNALLSNIEYNILFVKLKKLLDLY